jgi:hypothetical protein
MKISPAVKFSLPVILVLAIAFLTGCATTTPVDWNTRIGNYTYAQAVTDLGPPAREAKLNDGKLVCKWFIQPPVGPRFNSGMSAYGNNDFGADQTVGSGFNNQMLQLTFGTNSTLTAWSKSY